MLWRKNPTKVPNAGLLLATNDFAGTVVDHEFVSKALLNLQDL
jgi:hypothetical protein